MKAFAIRYFYNSISTTPNFFSDVVVSSDILVLKNSRVVDVYIEDLTYIAVKADSSIGKHRFFFSLTSFRLTKFSFKSELIFTIWLFFLPNAFITLTKHFLVFILILFLITSRLDSRLSGIWIADIYRVRTNSTACAH